MREHRPEQSARTLSGLAQRLTVPVGPEVAPLVTGGLVMVEDVTVLRHAGQGRSR